MNSTELLDDFRCAQSDDNHSLINPIQLSKCGHFVCKDCLPNDSKVQSIKCKTCGVITEDHFSEFPVSEGFKESLKFYLGNIFELIEKQTRSKLNELKSIKNVYIFEVFKFKL
jgi:hypothetical protein